VLAQVDDPRLRVLVVWLPIMESDTALAARQAESLLRDGRVRQFWDGSGGLGRALGDALAIPGDAVAWDVYLLYGAGQRWQAPAPKPIFWMHQLDALRGASPPWLDGAGGGASVAQGFDGEAGAVRLLVLASPP